MKGLKPFASLLLGCLVCAILSGCAASAPQNGPGALDIALIDLAEGVPGIAYRQLLIATGGVTPYTWTITAGTLPPGLSVTSDGIISGTPTTTGTFDFTVQVVDSQTPVHAIDTAPLSITINPPLSLLPSTLPNGLVGSSYSASIVASNGVYPYLYSVAFGSLPPGLTLTTNTDLGAPNTATISGTPTDAGVFNFTLQATDSLGEVATAAYQIVVTGRLQGPYAFTFNGFDTAQPSGSQWECLQHEHRACQAFYLVGSLTAAAGQNGNGTITGVLDQNGPGATLSSAVPLTGTYHLPTTSNFGTMTLTSALGTYQFSILLSTLSDSQLILADPNHPQEYGSGLLKKQTTTSLPANGANYAFGLFGNDPRGNRYAGAGTFSINASGDVTSGEEDTNDNGTWSGGPITITGGSLAPDPNNPGRGIAALTTSSGTATYVYYVASDSELVAIQTNAGGPVTIADVQQQTSAGLTGPLTLCKAGSTCHSVLELNGVSTSSGAAEPVAAIGVVADTGTTNSTGNIAGPGMLPGYYTDQSVGGTYTLVSYDTGTYTVDSSGRVTVDLQGATNQPVWYLSGTGQGFALGTDSTVMSGTLQSQTVPTSGFTLANFLGSYLGGTITPVLPTVTNEIDQASTPPPGGKWAQHYLTSGPLGLPPLQTFQGSYAIDPTYGAAYGRFAVCATNNEYCTGTTKFTYNPNNPPVDILYIFGSSSAGATGGKSGLGGLNLGILQPSGDAVVDPNPRVTAYGR
ncbi:MAG: Ig domain-containing protein [Candidatus Korobacteraceae bacterium]|jgi:putative Ig domain-containing protein